MGVSAAAARTETRPAGRSFVETSRSIKAVAVRKKKRSHLAFPPALAPSCDAPRLAAPRRPSPHPSRPTSTCSATRERSHVARSKITKPRTRTAPLAVAPRGSSMRSRPRAPPCARALALLHALAPSRSTTSLHLLRPPSSGIRRRFTCHPALKKKKVKKMTQASFFAPQSTLKTTQAACPPRQGAKKVDPKGIVLFNSNPLPRECESRALPFERFRVEDQLI